MHNDTELTLQKALQPELTNSGLPELAKDSRTNNCFVFCPKSRTIM